MTFSRGDVVLLHFPFSGGGGSKTRPALVIQNDQDNRRLSNVIVASLLNSFIRRAVVRAAFRELYKHLRESSYRHTCLAL